LQENRTFKNENLTFVLGVREGSILHVSDDQAELLGLKSLLALQLHPIDGKLIGKNVSIGSRIVKLIRQVAFA
jgi:hypothetical protein